MTFKRKITGIRLTGLGIPLLTVAASLGGVYMGQRMVAAGESNKVIREQLALAYNLTLSIPALALAVNTSAITTVSSADSGFRGAVYNDALKSYQGKITEIKTINALYVDDITEAVEGLSRCSEQFVNFAANHMLLERRDAGMPIVKPLMSYQNSNLKLERIESLNVTAYERVRCEFMGEQLNVKIAQVMKKHI